MVSVRYRKHDNALIFSGSGEISWKDTVDYKETTELVLLVGGSLKCKNASNLFAGFNKLIAVDGHLDTSECKDFSYMYVDCYCLVSPIKGLDTSKGEEFDFMHSDNSSLGHVTFNTTRDGRKFKNMFTGCGLLTSITGLTVPKQYLLLDITEVDSVRRLL